jgi:oligosaccharyltransferase complex subunit alpha (ribophorin I)
MKFTAVAAACLSLVSTASASANHATSASSEVIHTTFKPPQVFKNANLVHIISLEKNYVKESINVLIENISPEPQDEYFLPFTSERMEKVGGLEVKDRKNPDVAGFTVDAVEFDQLRHVCPFASWIVVSSELPLTVDLTAIPSSIASNYPRPWRLRANKPSASLSII